MVLEGVWPSPGHPQQKTRMSYRLLPDGTVEQSGVTSDDSGKTWQPGFDLIYTVFPREPLAPRAVKKKTTAVHPPCSHGEGSLPVNPMRYSQEHV